MTTFSDLIEKTRQHLMTGHPDRLNVLDANITLGADTLNLRYTNKGVSEAATIVIGLEEMHVVDLATVGDVTTLTVLRGYNGSIPAAHTAGDYIYVNPQFSSYRISQTVNQALHNLSANGLFRMNHVTIPANSVVAGYALGIDPTDFISVWKVRHSTTGPSIQWPVLRADEYWVDLHADDTIFPPDGAALFLRQGISSGEDIRVSYKQRFGQLVDLTDDVTTETGLHVEAHDLPPLDAAIDLLVGREIKRSFLNRQPEPRRQDEVPPGAANQSMLPILHRYEDRIKAEQTRLKRLYPGAI